jgi:oligopeptide transport system substrate-binding protein
MAKADASRSHRRPTAIRSTALSSSRATSRPRTGLPLRSGPPENNYKSTIGFDATKAKASSAAGYANGAGFELTLLQTDTATNQALGQFLQAEWKKHLGIDIKLEFVDACTRSSRFNLGRLPARGGRLAGGLPGPGELVPRSLGNRRSINKTSTSIQALDDLIGKAKFNRNNEERLKQYQDAEKLLSRAGQRYCTVVAHPGQVLVKPHIKGMVENKRAGDTFVPGG